MTSCWDSDPVEGVMVVQKVDAQKSDSLEKLFCRCERTESLLRVMAGTNEPYGKTKRLDSRVE